jgi:hypothetical protein
MIIRSGNSTHDATCLVAEGTRQTAAASATQAAVNTAEITFYRSVRASALANGCGVEASVSALRALGTGGV